MVPLCSLANQVLLMNILILFPHTMKTSSARLFASNIPAKIPEIVTAKPLHDN